MTFRSLHRIRKNQARLKQLAQQRGISLNKLIEELSTVALAEFDAHTRFQAIAAAGDPEVGLRLLDKLDSLTALLPQDD